MYATMPTAAEFAATQTTWSPASAAHAVSVAASGDWTINGTGTLIGTYSVGGVPTMYLVKLNGTAAPLTIPIANVTVTS